MSPAEVKENIPGVGKVTARKLLKTLEEHGYREYDKVDENLIKLSS